MAEERSLPGWPKKKLVKEVRRHLWHYGIRPARCEIWRATWAWADVIARSYWKVHWPLPSEIASQYILLLLIEMKQSHMLRLPYRASDHIPAEIAALLPITQQAELLAIADSTKKKRTPQRSPRRPRGSTASNARQRDTGQPAVEVEQPNPS